MNTVAPAPTPLPTCLAYENAELMRRLREAIRPLVRAGDRLIFRDAFRWKDDSTESVMPNHYEHQSINYLAEEFDYEVVHDFHHLAVIRPKARA